MKQTQPTTLAYGLWPSPLTPGLLAASLRLQDVAWDTHGSLVWLEGRGGRSQLVVLPPGGQAWREAGAGLSARGQVGYGGGDFGVGQGYVYFVDAGSGRLVRQALAGGEVSALTPAFGAAAAPVLSPDGAWLLYVHSYEGQDCLALVDAEGRRWPVRLAQGADFYMQPAWHPNSRRLAWISWNHPNMPWDGTSLYSGSLAKDGGVHLEDVQILAGGDQVSIFQPAFSPDGRSLVYASDESGWWHIYLHDLETGRRQALTSGEAEHAEPAWVQGVRRFAFSPNLPRLYYLRNDLGYASLWELDLTSGQSRQFELGGEYTWLEQLCISPDGTRLAVIASGSRTPARLLLIGLDGSVQIVRRATGEDAPADLYAQAQPLTWAGLDGGAVHGLFYPPHNPACQGIGAPPLIVMVHGGPTSQEVAAFDAQVQYFTSRGYAVLQPNFRGSTGYGRAYRNALHGNWGVYDVQDAVSGARHLAGLGRVETSKMVIFGGSSGGYSVLKALEDFPGLFKAGVCLYGISNQFALAADTHKFEAHYNDRLLGPLPQAAEIYRERSPLFFAERIQDALALFQGEDDPVVPRSQSDSLVEVLRRQGVALIYHVYPGEGHGFRKPETIAHFYQQVDRFLREQVLFA